MAIVSSRLALKSRRATSRSSNKHEPLSRKIGEEQWLPKVDAAVAAAAGGELIIDGFSCEMQLNQLSDLRSTPLISLIRRSLGC